ncbi:hypothetical protein [Flagellimonas aurea]|uniref:hypothetical protein n=1 Tax=Flagellimonas aurea TaxID=2915619 RepID=UPI0035D123A4
MKNLLRILDKYKAALGCLIVAILMFLTEYNKIKIKNESDLSWVHGTLKNYSFVDNLPRNGKRYIIDLVEYKNQFQIYADHIGLFNKSGFQESVQIGDTISLQIPIRQVSLLDSENEIIMIAGMNNNTRNYLVSRQVIMKQQGPAGVIAGFGFLFAGFISFIVKYKGLV